MSFSPIPAGTAESLRKLQCNFLWGSEVGGSKKIAWIKWEDICKQKGEGGLGVKNWRWFNLALLGKWVWRFFSQGDSLWAKVIRARHGRGVRGGLGVGVDGRRGGSGWWTKICSAVEGGFGDWFHSNLRKHIGNGLDTSFWEDIWCDVQPLCTKFPRLFQLSANKSAQVGEMGAWSDGIWRWELQWRRDLLDRDRARVTELENLLTKVCLLESDRDSWRLGDKERKLYSVKEAYHFLAARNNGDGDSEPRRPLAAIKVWKTIAPFKQQLTAWRMLRDRIPSRENLNKRMELSPEGTLCPCCASTVESTAHLLLHCKDVEILWRKVVDWVGCEWAESNGLHEHF